MDGESLFKALHHISHDNNVLFNGVYELNEDPLVSDKEQVQMTIQEVWKVTGYRFK